MDDTGQQQQQQMNNEIDSLLFRTGIYIDELKTLSNVEGFKPEDSIFDQDGNISSEGKEIIMNANDEDQDTSYKRFLLKLKVCLIEVGKIINLRNNIESGNLKNYLNTLNQVLKSLHSEEDQQNNLIKNCTPEKSLQECEKDLEESRIQLEQFRVKVEEALKTSKDEIEGFANTAKVLNDLKEEINNQIKEINIKGDKITDDEIDAFKIKIEKINVNDDGQEDNDIQRLIAEDIQAVIKKLEDLKVNLQEKREKKAKAEELEQQIQDKEGQAAALSSAILKADTEPIDFGAEESKTGPVEVDSVIKQTDGRESRMSMDGDVEFNEQIKKSDRNIEQIQKESQELDARIKESEVAADEEVEKTLAGLETITSGPGKSIIPEGPPTEEEERPPSYPSPPPEFDEPVTVGNQDDIKKPSETVESVVNEPETVESVNTQGDNPPPPTTEEVNLTEIEGDDLEQGTQKQDVPQAPTSTEESIERNEQLQADRQRENTGEDIKTTALARREEGAKPLIPSEEDVKQKLGGPGAEQMVGGRKRKQSKKKKRRGKRKSKKKRN